MTCKAAVFKYIACPVPVKVLRLNPIAAYSATAVFDFVFRVASQTSWRNCPSAKLQLSDRLQIHGCPVPVIVLRLNLLRLLRKRNVFTVASQTAWRDCLVKSGVRDPW